MADMSHLIAVELAANMQTDITGGGMPADAAGAYTLNICNDSQAAVSLSAIYLTDGAAPAARHKIHPRFVVEAAGWLAIQPVKLGDGWKLFLESSAAVSVQLIGRKEG